MLPLTVALVTQGGSSVALPDPNQVVVVEMVRSLDW